LADSGNPGADLALLGQAIRRLREELSLSAEELADAAGMTRQRIDMLETGRLDPAYELLLALAHALRTEPSAIAALAEQIKDDP
jgi:transcriptional regulator with XRE-family HTH domain